LRGAGDGSAFLKPAPLIAQRRTRAIPEYAHALGPPHGFVPMTIEPRLDSIQRLPVVMYLIINHAATPRIPPLPFSRRHILQRSARAVTAKIPKQGKE